MILNLTQHPATAEQVAAGVVDLPAEPRAFLQRLLTFTALPSRREVDQRAEQIAALVEPATCKQVMIGGAPYLMAPLERHLEALGIEPLYAYSERVSIEEPQPDGTVRKVNTFRHAGWVPA